MDERLERLRATLDDGASAAFEPFFAARVMRRITAGANRWETLHRNLGRAFVKFAVAGTAVAAIVAIYSLSASPSLDVYGSVLESLLGLPAPTLETALQVGDI